MLSFVSAHLEKKKQHEVENVEGVIMRNPISIIRYDQEQDEEPPAQTPDSQERFTDSSKSESSLDF